MRQRRGRRERGAHGGSEPQPPRPGGAPEPTTIPQPAYDPAVDPRGHPSPAKAHPSDSGPAPALPSDAYHGAREDTGFHAVSAHDTWPGYPAVPYPPYQSRPKRDGEYGDHGHDSRQFDRPRLTGDVPGGAYDQRQGEPSRSFNVWQSLGERQSSHYDQSYDQRDQSSGQRPGYEPRQAYGQRQEYGEQAYGEPGRYQQPGNQPRQPFQPEQRYQERSYDPLQGAGSYQPPPAYSPPAGPPGAGSGYQPPSYPQPQYDFESFYRTRQADPPMTGPQGQPAVGPTASGAGAVGAVLPGTQQPDMAASQQAPSQPGTGHSPAGTPPADPLARPRNKRRRRRVRTAVLTVLVLLLAAAGAGGGYLLLRTHGTPEQLATGYLSAWSRADYAAMQRMSVNVPPSGLGLPIRAAGGQLGVKRMSLKLGTVTTTGNSAVAHFTITDDLASGHVWTYQDRLPLLVRNRHWRVDWSPATIYPGLRAGERFSLAAQWPPRAQILADDGTVLSSPATIAKSGSLALLTGYLGHATAKQAKALGAPYRKGDVIGIGGLEQAYQKQLAGRPEMSIKIVGPGHRVDQTAVRFPARQGTPVRTSIDMPVQLAASAAVSSAKTSKPVDMVVVQPSTGRVLAVVERPGGFDRALDGIFPPGSTFKIITASALVAGGLTASSKVDCPSHATIDGRVFHNDNNEHYGKISFEKAFAVSCNSTFINLATQRLTGNSLARMAKTFGLNATPKIGIPVTLGHFKTPHDPVDLAADAFGQGTDLVNPLSQATVAAAIDNGTWRPPLLVISPKLHQVAKPHVLSKAILRALRPMMRAVVTGGTAAGVGFPPGVYGKTGTAQIGTGAHPPSDGWFIGYQGDIAFAVVVENGGYGASSAGPVVNSFLHHL